MVSPATRYPPAPIDPADLEPTLRPFGESRMLPRAAYVDQAVFDWELRHFFGGWVCLARSDQLRNPGDQRAEASGAGSVLLVRDEHRDNSENSENSENGENGELRAFANTCRHRGHELLPCGAATNRKAIVCPYHSWGYSLAGEVRAAIGFRDQPGFDAAQWGLVRLPVAEWHGLVFVDGSRGSAGPLPLETLGAVVAPYEPERLVTAGQRSYDVAANWKILAENYQECYHCPAIHPELCRISPPDSGRNFPVTGPWIGGVMDLRDGMATMSLDGTSGGVPLRGLGAAGLRTVAYVNVLPNVLLSLHPDYVMTHRLVPLAVDRTRIECGWAFAPEAVARPGFDPGYAVEFWDLINQQDWAACESVQRGLVSPHALPGPLSPAEDAVYSFVTTIARGYLGEPLTS
jgi:Rieske 2Fe-2S family protein